MVVMWKNIDFEKVLIAILFIVIIAMGIYTQVITNRTEEVISEIEHFDDTEGKYTKIYYDQEIAVLKKENRELYDSLKKQKDKIEFLTQFKYSKKYSTDTVFTSKDTIKNDTVMENDTIIQEYTYKSEPNDTLNYELKLGSTVEPNWYKLDFEISDKFTIVNKTVGDGISETNIESSYNGKIEDVTVFSKKEKRNGWDRIAFGPSVTAGYDFTNGKMGLVVGISVTYNLFGNKKR